MWALPAKLTMIALTRKRAMIDLEGMYICPQGLASQKIKNVFNGFSWFFDLKLRKKGGLGDQLFASRFVIPVTGSPQT